MIANNLIFKFIKLVLLFVFSGCKDTNLYSCIKMFHVSLCFQQMLKYEETMPSIYNYVEFNTKERF